MSEAGLSSVVRIATEVFDEVKERGTLSELLIHAKCFVAILISYNKLHSTETRELLETERDFSQPNLYFLCILCFQMLHEGKVQELQFLSTVHRKANNGRPIFLSKVYS